MQHSSAPAGFETYKPVEFRERMVDNVSKRPASPKISPKVLTADSLNLLSLPVIVDDEEPQDSLVLYSINNVPNSARRESLGSPGGVRPASPVVLTPINVLGSAQDNRNTSASLVKKAFSNAGLPPASPSSTPRDQSRKLPSALTFTKTATSGSKGLFGIGMKISDTLPHAVQSVEGLLDEDGETVAATKIRVGDILEIVDGIFVTDKTIEEMKSIILGPYGSICTLSLRSQPNAVMYTVRVKRHITNQPSIAVDAEISSTPRLATDESVIANLRMEPPTTPVLSIRQSFQPMSDATEKLNLQSQSLREEILLSIRKETERSKPKYGDVSAPMFRNDTASLSRSGTRTISQSLPQPASPRLGVLPPVLEVKKILFTSIHDAMQLARSAGDMVLHRLLSGLDEQVRAVEDEFTKSEVNLREQISALEFKLQEALTSAAARERENTRLQSELQEQVNSLKYLEATSSQFLGQLAQAAKGEEELLIVQAQLREEIQDLKCRESGNIEAVSQLAEAKENTCKVLLDFESFRIAQDSSRNELELQRDKALEDMSALQIQKDLASTRAEIFRKERDKAVAQASQSQNTMNRLEIDLQKSIELENARMARVNELEEQLPRIDELESQLFQMKSITERLSKLSNELALKESRLKDLENDISQKDKELIDQSARITELEDELGEAQIQLAQKSKETRREMERSLMEPEMKTASDADERARLTHQLAQRDLEIDELQKKSAKMRYEYQARLDDAAKQHMEEEAAIKRQLDNFSAMVSDLLANQDDPKVPALEREVESIKAAREKVSIS